MYVKPLSKKIWEIPKTTNKPKDKSSLLELFFDIILVAFLSGMVHSISEMFSPKGEVHIFRIFFIFASLINVLLFWINLTFYNARYEKIGSIRHRFFIFIIMIGLMLITIPMYFKLGLQLENFIYVLKIQIIGYSMALMSLFYLIFSVCSIEKNIHQKDMLEKKYLGIIFAKFSWLSLFFLNMLIGDGDYKLTMIISAIFWFIGFFSWTFFDYWSRSKKLLVNTSPISEKYLKERFAILFIVFMGETIIQIIVKSFYNLENDSSINVILYSISALFLLFLVWWLFNDVINYDNIIDRSFQINIYYSSIAFLFLFLSSFNIAISLSIENPFEKEGKLFLIFTLIGLLSINAIIFLLSKNYNQEDKVILGKKIRYLIYISPIISLIFLPLFFVKEINSIIFLFISLGFLTVYISLISILLIKSRKQDSKLIEQQIKKDIQKEEKYLKKIALKYGDLKYHEEYNFEFNKYSKFLKNKKNKK